MNTYVNLCQYLVQFLLEWEMLQTKVAEKIKTHIFVQFFFFKSYLLWDNVEKYCTAGQATDDNIIRRMRIACWIPKATDTHSLFVILIAFPLLQWLHDDVSKSRYTYIGCLVNDKLHFPWTYSKSLNYYCYISFNIIHLLKEKINRK